MGSYIQGSLRDGEIVRYQAHISLWSLMPGFVIGVAALIGSIFSMGLITARFGGVDTGAIMSLLLAIFGIFTLISALAAYYTTELAITNRRVLAKRGWIARTAIELLLHKIESVQVIQQPNHRLFKYGTVVVSGAGDENAVMKGISHPMRFRDEYNEAEEQRVKSVMANSQTNVPDEPGVVVAS